MIELEIQGMNCQHCVHSATQALRAVEGVSDVEVDLSTGIARVEGSANPSELVAAVVAAGYSANEV